MCGIAGIFHLNGQPVDEWLLVRMTDAIRHRGPDDGGYFQDGSIGLGNRRLSIIDLAGGRQPMTNEARTVWVVYNGEVYNFRELRHLLESRGHRFRTSSDTEVILRVYEEFGPAGVERLRGMFAFALWDAPKRRLLLVRDQVGIKPLYYYQDSQGLVFASEIRSLLLHPRVPRCLSLQALDRYLCFSYVPGEETIFEGIRRLPPGHLMLCQGRQVEIRPYWRLSPAPASDMHRNNDRYTAELLELLEAAVERHMIADVPVGLFLSGGLDSASIAAFLARMGRRDAPTFSVGFDSDRAGYFNELEDARRVARDFGMVNHSLVVRPNLPDLLPQVIRSLEEPIGDPSAFLTYLICQTAGEHVKVALTGIGGDELFGGYRRYVGASLVTTLRRIPRTLRDVTRWGAQHISATDESRIGYHLTTLWRLLDAVQAPHPDAYINMLSYFTPAMKARLYRPEVQAALADHDPAAEFRAHFSRPDTGDTLSRIFYLDLMTFLPDNLLLFSDKMSMSHSLELRVPLLDLELVQYAASLPSHLRIRRVQMKYLLKKAMAPLLPSGVLSKPKQGFSAPVGMWIRRELSDYARDLLSPEAVGRRGFWNGRYVARLLAEHWAGQRDWGYHLFCLMVFELWCRTFMDGFDTDTYKVDSEPFHVIHRMPTQAAGGGARQWGFQ